jgi:hypothetical protein
VVLPDRLDRFFNDQLSWMGGKAVFEPGESRIVYRFEVGGAYRIRSAPDGVSGLRGIDCRRSPDAVIAT